MVAWVGFCKAVAKPFSLHIVFLIFWNMADNRKFAAIIAIILDASTLPIFSMELKKTTCGIEIKKTVEAATNAEVLIMGNILCPNVPAVVIDGIEHITTQRPDKKSWKVNFDTTKNIQIF